MVEIIYTDIFSKEFHKIKDHLLKEKIKKQLQKIIENPEIGKPLRYNLKGERSIYIKPYRLVYSFQENTIILLKFHHRDSVYD